MIQRNEQCVRQGVWLWLGMVLCGLSAACVPLSQRLASDEQATQIDRLAFLTFPLAVAATASCPFERELTYGFVLEGGAPRPFDGAGEPVRPIAIRFVHPDLPAGGVDLKPGDQLLAINETSVSGMTVEDAHRLISRVSRARIQPLTLLVVRGGKQREMNLWGIQACRFTVQVIDNQAVNALADGDRIFVTTGMLRFVESDEELAWVLAHELAHNVLGHPQQTRLRGVLNLFLSASIGERGEGVLRPELEMQADALASRLLAQAGYDVRKAGLFLRRLALVEHSPEQQSFSDSHPATATRIAAFDQALEQIEKQMRQGGLSRVNMRQEQDAAMASEGPPERQP